jgi:hypothetical protein
MDTNSYTMLPEQAVSLKKKQAKDFKIMKDSAKYYIGLANFKDDVLPLYRYANGSYINTRDYAHLTNELGLSKANKDQRRILEKGNATKLRNFPIITPIVNKFMGEMRMRQNDYIVQAINADVINKKTAALLDKVNKYLEQEAINLMNAQGMDTGVPTQEQPPLEEVVKAFNISYVDERSVIGQRALNIIVEECKLSEKRLKLFFDWIVAGYAFSYKCAENDTIISEVVAPVDFWYAGSPDIDFVEDTEAQVRRLTRFPIEKIPQKFPELKKEDLKKIEDRYGITFSPGKFVAGDVHTGYSNTTGYIDNRNINQQEMGHHTTIYHIVWKSQMLRKTLVYIDILGEQQVMFVDEDYEFDESHGDIDIKEEWIDEYWECYQITKDIFSEPRPIPYQRYTFTGAAKSPYNGRAFSDRFAENMSIVKLGLDFQKEVNEIRYRVGRTLAKNNDNVLLIDISVIPNRPGFNRDDFMHFMKEFGIAFIDRNQKGADRSFNQYTVLQASQIDAVFKGYELLNIWRNYYWDLVGMNPQRLGQVSSSAGRDVTENAVQASSEISEENFARFEEFEEREVQGFLDLSKFAWREGKQAIFKRGDGEEEFLQVEGADYTEMEFRVIAKKAGKERQKVKAFKEMLLPMIQNSGQQGVKTSLVAQLLDMDSMSEVKKLAKSFDEAEAKANQEAQQSQQQAEQTMKQEQQQHEVALQQFELLKQEKDINKDIQVALIKASTMDTMGSGVDVPIDMQGIKDASVALIAENNKAAADQTKANLQKSKIESDERMNALNANVKKYDSDVKLKVAKSNKNKYDK